MTVQTPQAANVRQSYSGPAKWLHWIMATLILAGMTAGIAMKNFVPEGPLQSSLYANHEAIGFLVLVLVTVRILVRLWLGAPRPAPGLTRFERIASISVHHLLYLLMVALPIGGWLALSAYGNHISVFGLFEVPALIGRDEKLSETLFKLHGIGGLFAAALVVAHIGGGLMHLIIKRDGVFQRMWPGRG